MASPNLWQQVLATLEIELDPAAVSTWFRNTQLYETSEDKIIIACTDSYSKSIIQKRYADKIADIIRQIEQRKYSIDFIVKPLRVQTPVHGPLFDEAPDLKASPLATNSSPTTYTPRESSTMSIQRPEVGLLNPQMTLDNYVVGPSNRVVHAAAVSVMENPGHIYNPLFIYGSTGVGKTHLLHAIGNGILENFSSYRIMYTTSEKFVNDMVEHLRQKKDMQQFRSRYRTCNALLIDDIQFLAGKESSQEEFYHSFNELQQIGSQIVVVSDREPSQIQGLTDRLISRFKGGLMVQISPPDYETRLAIVRTKAEELQINLSDAIYEYIAEQSSQNVREIQGTLLQVKSLANTQSQPINLAFVRSVIEPKADVQTVQKRITPELILELVTRQFDTSIKDLCGKKRKKEIVLPRQMTMFLLRNELGMNLEEIGEVLGGRDHTTVMHGCDRIKQAIEQNNNPLLRSHLHHIRQELYG
ncbi:chromosomal replication initiator protein DnaA [candidate division WWE3 bacterium]|nr:chromosomal replication initiator protein DnaA [candidate division WWE3 bacterium]